jgi:hypothetical protein
LALRNMTIVQQGYESFCSQFKLLDHSYFQKFDMINELHNKKESEDDKGKKNLLLHWKMLENDEMDNNWQNKSENQTYDIIDLNKTRESLGGGVYGMFDANIAQLNTLLKIDNYITENEGELEDDQLETRKQFDCIDTIQPILLVTNLENEQKVKITNYIHENSSKY